MGVFASGSAQGFAQGAELVRRHQQAKEENELQRKLLKLREDMFTFESKKLQSALTGQESLAQLFEGITMPNPQTIPEVERAETEIPPSEVPYPMGRLAAALTRMGQPKEAVGLLGLGEQKPLQEVPQGTTAGIVGGRQVLMTPPKQAEPTAPESRMFQESLTRHMATGKTPEQAFNLAKDELATFRAQSAGAILGGRKEAEMDIPLSFEELSRTVDPKTLEPMSPGTTKREALQRRAVHITEKQKENLAGLDQVTALVDTIGAMADNLITAPNAMQAALQGTQLTAGAFAKTNTVAASYQDSRQAVLGVISRYLGGERGVLTDRDIFRIDKWLPGFRDTKQIKDMKMGTIRIILGVAQEAQKRKVTGQSFDQSGLKKKIDNLFAVLEKSSTEGKITFEEYKKLLEKK